MKISFWRDCQIVKSVSCGMCYLLDELIVDGAAELVQELNWMARGRVVRDLLAWRVARLTGRRHRHVAGRSNPLRALKRNAVASYMTSPPLEEHQVSQIRIGGRY